jgi:hypothetical protein
MLKRILDAASGSPGSAAPPQQPLNVPGHWDFFLSHGQAAAGDQVKTLALLLGQREKPDGSKCTVWYDHDMSDCSEAAMEEGAVHSTNFILFLSGDPTVVSTGFEEDAVDPNQHGGGDTPRADAAAGGSNGMALIASTSLPGPMSPVSRAEFDRQQQQLDAMQRMVTPRSPPAASALGIEEHTKAMVLEQHLKVVGMTSSTAAQRAGAMHRHRHGKCTSPSNLSLLVMPRS